MVVLTVSPALDHAKASPACRQVPAATAGEIAHFARAWPDREPLSVLSRLHRHSLDHESCQVLYAQRVVIRGTWQPGL